MADAKGSDQDHAPNATGGTKPRVEGNDVGKADAKDGDAISAETGPAIDVDSAHDRAS